MTPVETMLSDLLGEDVRVRTHPTGPCRFIPVGDPANSPNADLWHARGAGGWYPTADEAAVALAFDLGLRQGRAEGAPPPKISGKVEAQVLAVVQALAAAGGTATVSLVVEKTTSSMMVPAGQRDRRREFARRAFLGLVRRGVLVVADDGAVTACRTRDAASGGV
jgi:hypothetical protein